MAAASKGTCQVCKGVFPKNQMTRHLAKCAAGPAPDEPWLHVVVEGMISPDYWLHVRAGSRATLAHLDAFLRDIWLECCGHLSEFRINETSYLSEKVDDPYARRMNAAIGRILGPGDSFTYLYDFGSSTELRLRAVAERQGPPVKDRIVLLARNEPPSIACDQCGAPATLVCSECSWSGAGFVCDACGRSHECGEEMLLPLVNSPRAGVCAYTG